jgi:hypothetical protein
MRPGSSAVLAAVLVLGGTLAAGSGSGANAAVGTCRGKPVTITAAPGIPTTGTDGDDVIGGTAGNDFINAGAGRDVVCAGAGNDTVSGGDGKDILVGQDGADRLNGDGDSDRVLGNAGADTLTGGDAGDVLRGGAGTNSCPALAGDAHAQCHLAAVSPDPDVIPAATFGVPIGRAYTGTNLLDPIVGRLVGNSLASAKISQPTISDGSQQQFQVNVVPGSTSVSAKIGNPSDPGADLDLFLYNCTTGSCVLVAQSAGNTAEEVVSASNPAAGTWIVLVDGFGVPDGTTSYDYLDQFANPVFGSVSVADADALRPTGATWTVPATVTVLSAPTAGRVIRGEIAAVGQDGVRFGSGAVIVQSVS